jgi:M6 family metalloprotease-like protein
MNFTDKKITHSIAEFEALMNQAGYSSDGATGSVKDFYRENSYGQMDLTVTVIGPYEAPNTAAYYAPDNRGPEFARIAAQAADADIDFNEYANEAGELENFHIIFAGHGDEAIGNGKQIWAHKYHLNSAIYLDNVKIYVYSCSPELRGSSGASISTIGVVCHELCHVFGADDYYDTDGSGNGGEYEGTGNWDLMAGGSWNGNKQDGSSPAHINMFQKILYGWVNPVELTDSLTVMNMPNSAENPGAYFLKPSTNNEMYVLENRQKIGFDSYVPGNGLLIYHIHTSAATGTVDNRSHPQRVYVVYASSLISVPTATPSSYGQINSSGATFTNVSGRNEFSGTSTPQMFRWSGVTGLPVENKPLTNIAQAGGLVSFKYRGGGPEEVLYDSVTNFQAKIEYNEILLTWDYPANGNYPTGYEVYRNNELIATLPVNTRTYVDSDRNTGAYTYCIKAAYPGNILSEAVCRSVDFTRTYCFPAVYLDAEILDDIIRLSWEAPVDAGTQAYTYTLYVNNKLIAKDLEVTSFDYQPRYGGDYHVSVIAYTADCRSAQADTTVSFHPELSFEFRGIPEPVYTKQTYPIAVEVKEGETEENINYQWSFSNDLATIVPGEKSNIIQLVTGATSGTGTLSAAITYFTYSTVLTKELVIQYPLGINNIATSNSIVYPNPVKDVLTITGSDIAAIRITDINGRVIYANTGIQTQTVPVAKWAKGIYFVRIQTPDGIQVQKVIKD